MAAELISLEEICRSYSLMCAHLRCSLLFCVEINTSCEQYGLFICAHEYYVLHERLVIFHVFLHLLKNSKATHGEMILQVNGFCVLSNPAASQLPDFCPQQTDRLRVGQYLMFHILQGRQNPLINITKSYEQRFLK